MKSYVRLFNCILIAHQICLAPNPLVAQAPERINIQGVLREDAGGLQDGLFDFRVRLLDGANPVYTRLYSSVPVNSGVFAIDLDPPQGGTLAELLREYPGVQVELTVDGVTMPPMPLGSSPFALYSTYASHADDCGSLNGTTAASFVKKSELVDNDPTTSPVSWRGITNLPADCSPGEFMTGFDSATGNAKCAAPPVEAACDITAVTAGNGLLGGAESGDVQLSIDFTKVQARVANGCEAGSAIRAIGQDGTPTCETVGKINSVTLGNGLTGGTTNGDVTIGVNTDYVQRRLTGTCPAGSFIGAVDSSGQVTCNRTYERIVVVSPTGTETGNGIALLNALASITDASVDKPRLLLIEPGVYDIQTASLLMKPYIDVAGSGTKATTIKGGGFSTWDSATVIGAVNSEIRDLSINCNTGSGRCTSLLVSSPATSASLRNVLIQATAPDPRGLTVKGGGTAQVRVTSFKVAGVNDAVGVRVEGTDSRLDISSSTVDVNTTTGVSSGMELSEGVAIIRNVDINSQDGLNPRGIFTGVPQITASNVTARAISNSNRTSIGFHIQGAGGTFHNCRFVGQSSSGTGHAMIIGTEKDLEFSGCKFEGYSGTTKSEGVSGGTMGKAVFHNCSIIGATGTSGTVYFANTMLDGTFTAGSGTSRCLFSFKGDLTGVGANCQ